MKKVSISIIIRSKNEEKHLEELLLSIFNQEINKEFEVILVDDSSEDNTVKIAKKFNVKIVPLLSDKFTYGNSINRGIKEATGEIIVLISAHVKILSKSWLNELVKPFNKDNKVSATYGRQISNPTINPFEFVTWNEYFPSVNMKFNSKSDSLKNLHISNANAAYRKDFLPKKYFNENLPYAEDLLMGFILLSKGFTINYVPKATIFHTHPIKLKNWSRKIAREVISIEMINKLTGKVLKVNFSPIFFIFFDVISSFYDFFRYLMLFIKNRLKTSKILMIFLYFFINLKGKLLGHYYFSQI
ncbi:MAG: glycosyltransferase [Candidatus Hodarchaeota archaeon]